ncbi:sulfotransferase family protein [Mycobacterium numidiamassiliense]
MPRSGTSALTRIVSLCGAALPAAMMGADSGNARGYWEPRKALRLNHAILHRRGSSTYDPSLRLQEDGAFGAAEKEACIAEIAEYLDTLPEAPLVIIKDLQITALSDMWFEAARLVGFDVAAVIAVRHPQEVAASLGALMHATPELASALWLKYNLLAERQTRNVPRVFVDYADVLDDWRQEVARISASIGIDLSTHDGELVEEFLTEDLRHQRHCGPVQELFGADWMSTVYGALRVATRDEPLDTSALDRVFEAYRASELAFRKAFEDFHHHSNNMRVRIFRPFIWKLIELIAILKRRRGTWA